MGSVVESTKDESNRIPALKREYNFSNKETNLNIYCKDVMVQEKYKVERLIPVLLIIKAFLDKV